MAATILPISSELHFAYITNLSSNEDVFIALAIATLGNSLGGLSCYVLGHLGKWIWLEKYFKINEEKIIKYKTKLESFGGWPAFFCWLPIVGDPIAVTYGLMKSPLRSFLIYMSLGKFLRYLFIIYLI